MRKLIFLFIICHQCIFAQRTPSELTPQMSMSSCWAATLEMASKKLAPSADSLNQCYFISKSPSRRDTTLIKCCSCVDTASFCSPTRVIKKDEFLNLTKSTLSAFFPQMTGETLNLEHFKNFFTNVPLKPIIYDYRYGSIDSHIVLLSGMQTQNFSSNEESFIKVLDPWTTCKGLAYYMSFERYKLQPEWRTSASGIAGGKYVIYFNKTTLTNVSSRDDIYMSNIFSSYNPDSLVSNFLSGLSRLTHTNLTLDDDFFITTNLPKTNLSDIYTDLKLKVVEVSSHDSLNLATLTVRVENLLNKEFDEHYVFLKQSLQKDCSDSIKTVLSISKKKDFWNIYHLENGKKWDDIIRRYSCEYFVKSQLNFWDKALTWFKFKNIKKLIYTPVAILHFQKQDEYYILFIQNQEYYLSNVTHNQDPNSSSVLIKIKI